MNRTESVLDEETIKKLRAAEPRERARHAHNYGDGKPMSEDRLRELRASTPPDTRDFTARYFGDPLPWRSALAQKGGAQ
jgi:hypothetical protein